MFDETPNLIILHLYFITDQLINYYFEHEI